MGTRLGGVTRLVLETYYIMLASTVFMHHGLLIFEIMLNNFSTSMPRVILDDTCVHICDIHHCYYPFIVLIFSVEMFIEIEFVAQRPLACCNSPCSTFSFADRFFHQSRDEQRAPFKNFLNCLQL